MYYTSKHECNPQQVNRALEFATIAHGDQMRKYVELPYIVHPISVYRRVLAVTKNTNMHAAALLHDTVEDTYVTIDDIVREFGENIAVLVNELTSISIPSDGNRAHRKHMDLVHTSRASPDAKTIKLADVIDNTQSIITMDVKFARVYMAECRDLLDVLIEGNSVLYSQADTIISDYWLTTEVP